MARQSVRAALGKERKREGGKKRSQTRRTQLSPPLFLSLPLCSLSLSFLILLMKRQRARRYGHMHVLLCARCSGRNAREGEEREKGSSSSVLLSRSSAPPSLSPLSLLSNGRPNESDKQPQRNCRHSSEREKGKRRKEMSVALRHSLVVMTAVSLSLALFVSLFRSKSSEKSARAERVERRDARRHAG